MTFNGKDRIMDDHYNPRIAIHRVLEVETKETESQMWVTKVLTKSHARHPRPPYYSVLLGRNQLLAILVKPESASRWEPKCTESFLLDAAGSHQNFERNAKKKCSRGRPDTNDGIISWQQLPIQEHWRNESETLVVLGLTAGEIPRNGRPSLQAEGARIEKPVSDRSYQRFSTVVRIRKRNAAWK
ncbi:hypothetical protein GJ744_007128 [Endocarpon pusillum]|uniref:Uncharacterized protein n=1 Tax=Endocarpon pusillum TaxID=364733 RepID=A0A8H7E4B8_9EURO|nr:hypothetical protein GJ744_007128 [Endocarpon pusillum]